MHIIVAIITVLCSVNDLVQAKCNGTESVTPGIMSLVYDEQVKIVLVEGDEDTLACAGDMLMVRNVAGKKTWKADQMCGESVFISGSLVNQTSAKSPTECRQQCQDTTSCLHWRFKTGWATCGLFYNKTYSKDNSKYVSGYTWCTLPGDEAVWVSQSQGNEFSLSPFLLPCQEAVLQVEYEDAGKEEVIKMIIEHVPHLKITEDEAHLAVEIENEDFKSCPDLKFELQCLTPESVTYRSIINFTQTTVYTGDIQGNKCRLRAWLSGDILNLEYFTYLGPSSRLGRVGTKDEGMGTALVITIIGVVIGFGIVVALVVVFGYRKKNSSETQEQFSLR